MFLAKKYFSLNGKIIMPGDRISDIDDEIWKSLTADDAIETQEDEVEAFIDFVPVDENEEEGEEGEDVNEDLSEAVVAETMADKPKTAGGKKNAK